MVEVKGFFSLCFGVGVLFLKRMWRYQISNKEA